MEQNESVFSVHVVWRGEKFVVDIDRGSTLLFLGEELQKLTNVKADTVRLIVTQASGKGSKLLSPFCEEHSRLSLAEAHVLEGKSIRMLGASSEEVDEVLQNEKKDLRIAGFEEEENRARRRSVHVSPSLKLPQGAYIFCDFRPLELPGMLLNPPPSEALKRMHMLASDRGIVAIMSKYRWRVGLLTEMPPVGYVGVSPRCLLGLNKNAGEEISLRLRADDLKGFRNYESVKKTLLHELAHMVHSEHDVDFYALDRKLNHEAYTLDWTKSKGRRLGNGDYTSSQSLFFGGEDSSCVVASGRGSPIASSGQDAVVEGGNSSVGVGGWSSTARCEVEKAVEMVRREVGGSGVVFKTLLRIIRNLIEHPGEEKFRRLRVRNSLFQTALASHTSVMDLLLLLGFVEDIVCDESYLVMDKDDLSILHIAKSSLELISA